MNTRIGKLTAGILLVTGMTMSLQASAWWSPGYGGSDWGPFDGFGDMMGDMDFNMSFRSNARSRLNGYGYSRPYYGYGYPYAPMPVVYAPPAVQPAAPVAAEAVASRGPLRSTPV